LDFHNALMDHLKRDMSNFRKGIEWMEVGTLKTGEFDNCLIVDRTKETIKAYRRTLAELERTLASLEEKER
jgi:hypothetical protein